MTRQRQNAVAGTTPLAIPELLELIISFLDQVHLRTTIPLVCKQWSTVAKPLIVRRLYWNPEWLPSIHLTSDDTSTSPAFLGADFNKRMLPKLGSIQVLQCQLVKKPLASSLGSRIGNSQLSDPTVKNNLWKEFLQRLQDLAKEDKLRNVRELDLFEMMDPETKILPLLKCLPNLTRLRLENVMMGGIPLGRILEDCPGLQSLEIVDALGQACRAGMIGALVDDDMRSDAMDPKEGANERRVSGLVPVRLKLRRLRLKRVRVTADLLRRLLRACPELQELGLVFLARDTLVENEVGARAVEGVEWAMSQPVWTKLYQDISGWCPRLRTFECSTPHAVEDIMAWIPGLTGLGVMGNVLCNVAAFKILRTHVDRLTTLRIHGSLTRVHPLLGGGDALHDYLCDAPLLLHLYAPHARIYLDRFDLKHHFTLVGARYVDSRLDSMDNAKLGQKYNRPYLHQKIWACRNLKTLQIEILCRDSDTATDESSRLVFGYLSKVVPNLEELVVVRYCSVLRFRGGMCLLQRMHRLRKLVMTTNFKQAWTDHDFEWVARTLPGGMLQRIKAKRLLAALEADERGFRKRNPWSLDATLAKEKGKGDSGDIVGRYVFDGVDMKHVGLLNDLVDVYKEREAGKWTCWPEMEWLEVIHGAWDVISSRTFSAIIGRCRPDIRVNYHDSYERN